MAKHPILEIKKLHKNYGKLTAVNQLNLTIEEGVIFGLLGPNGSGKTTTLGMILGVINSTSGSYNWFGKGNNASLRQKIGAILEQPIFYPYMSAIQNLEITCMIKNVDKNSISQILETVGLFERRNDSFKTFSLGMKQRLAIGAALIGNPKVLILDEPTNGLDPQGIVQIRTLIKEIADSGKTIILASHLLDEVQKVCSHFCILNHGNLIYQGVVKDDFSDGVTIRLGSTNNDQMVKVLQNFLTIDSINVVDELIEIKIEELISAEKINTHLFENNIVLNHLSIVEKTLEDQFLEILNSNK